MTKSVSAAKALKRRPQGLVALVAAGVATIVLAASCSTASAGRPISRVPRRRTPGHGTCSQRQPLPQGNGGDGDADNNGRPSDVDGNI
jgi:hypothetical protein